jgi:hypothetical protein
MTVLATVSTQIVDWKALLELHSGTLLPRARELGATRYRVFRNVKSAAEVLIVMELPSCEDAEEMARFIAVQPLPRPANATSERTIWEDMGWEVIGG